ncbi:MAG: hypothetical protein QF565_09005 [Arenicellales bacterium]|jgi:hypothetical protein|nr:hypothetical protein [Arenicellales bacterium]MDP7637641.1 hypothetical protein [Phycisphaerae bacterium]
MIYLTWKLSEGTWGTGPEEEVASRGGKAYPSEFCDTSTGLRLGYMPTSCDMTGLETWEITEITEAEALTFAQNYYPEAEVLPSGELTGNILPVPEDIE